MKNNKIEQEKAIELTSKEITCLKEHALKPQERMNERKKRMHSIENANVQNIHNMLM